MAIHGWSSCWPRPGPSIAPLRTRCLLLGPRDYALLKGFPGQLDSNASASESATTCSAAFTLAAAESLAMMAADSPNSCGTETSHIFARRLACGHDSVQIMPSGEKAIAMSVIDA